MRWRSNARPTIEVSTDFMGWRLGHTLFPRAEAMPERAGAAVAVVVVVVVAQVEEEELAVEEADLVVDQEDRGEAALLPEFTITMLRFSRHHQPETPLLK